MIKSLLIVFITVLGSCTLFEREVSIWVRNDSKLSFDSIVIWSPVNHTIAKGVSAGAVMSTTFTLEQHSRKKGSFLIKAYQHNGPLLSTTFGYFSRTDDIQQSYQLVINNDGTIKQVR